MSRLAAALALVAAVLSWGPALATGEITVDSQAYENHFPKDITFQLRAHADQDITKITFYHRIGNTSSVTYAYPTFTPGRSVDAQYVLVAGSARGSGMAPGSEIEYYYEIEDSAGARLKTDPASIVYADTRFTWRKLEGPQIVVNYYGPEQQAQVAFKAAEETLVRMKATAGASLERPATIYLYRTKQDMDLALPFRSEATSREVSWGGMAFPAVDVVVMLGPSYDLASVTAHELTHLLTAQLTDNPFSRIPAWLNEGLSMYAGGQYPANQRAVSEAVRNKSLLNLRTISSFPGKPEDIDLFYGEAYSLVRYLIIAFGPDKMAHLLATFKQGDNTNDALTRVYGFDVDVLEAWWRADIGAPPAAGAGVGPSQPQAVPTYAPLGAGQPQPQSTPVSAQPQGQTGAVPYALLAAGAILLSMVVGFAFQRSKLDTAARAIRGFLVAEAKSVPPGDRFLDLARQGKNTWWRYFLAVGLILAGGFVFEIFSVLLFAIAIALDNDPGTYWDLPTGNFVGADPSIYTYFAFSLFIGVLLSLLLVVRLFHKRPMRTLITPYGGFDWRRASLGFGGFFALLGVASIAEALLFPGRYQLTWNPGQLVKYLPLVFILIPIQAATEEIFFRGYLMQALGRLTRRASIPVVVSSVVFMLMHITNPEVTARSPAEKS